MREDFTAFVPEDGSAPFIIQMAGISYCDDSYDIYRRSSEIYGFEYIIKGKGYVRQDDVSFTAEAGDIYLLSIGHEHHYASDPDDPWIKIWFNVSGKLVDSVIKLYNITKYVHIKGLNILELFEEFVNCTRMNIPQKQIFDRCAVIFLKVVQEIANYNKDIELGEVSPIAQQLKKKIDNLNDFAVNFDDLMQDIFCTKAHAIRLFKAEYGITPYQYFLNKKQFLAEMLLANGNIPIKKIAYMLGFDDTRYFSAFFKSRNGLPPYEYRTKMKNTE